MRTEKYFIAEAGWPIDRVVVAASWVDDDSGFRAFVFLVPDADVEWAEGLRLTFPDLTNSGITPESIVREEVTRVAATAIRAQVTEVWKTEGFQRPPPDVTIRDCDKGELLRLRLRGHGQKGLEMIHRLSGDEELRQYARQLLDTPAIRVTKGE